MSDDSKALVERLSETLGCYLACMEDVDKHASAIMAARDRIDALTAEVERRECARAEREIDIAAYKNKLRDLTAENERLRLDLAVAECLQDSAYIAGAKFGWNCATTGDHGRFRLATFSTEHIVEIKRINEARAVLESKG